METAGRGRLNRVVTERLGARLLYAIGQTRSFVATLDIEFRDPRPRYDFSRDVVVFGGMSANQQKDCAISREALDAWCDAEGKGQEGYLRAFRENRAEIQAMARDLHLNEKVPSDGAVLIKTTDIKHLRAKIKSQARHAKSRR